MADEEINYTKEVLGSNLNLIFIGVMALLTLVSFNPGFLLLLLAGEIGALFIAQNPRVQRIIRSQKNKDKKIEIEEAETTIVKALPMHYQNDFQSVRRLCDEIEKRSAELTGGFGGGGTNLMITGIVEKLSAFRYDYARMLRAHHLLSTRNYRNIQSGLESEIRKAEQAVEREQSQQVRHALNQNLYILRQRLARISKLDELVRLLEVRLQVVRNSLSLIQDEVYTFTDIAGISGLVDNLLTNLSLSDEFRTAYEEVLNTEASTVGLATLEGSSIESGVAALPEASGGSEPFTPAPPPRERIRRVK
ncbi:MAG TPA: hypothetical protein VFD58_24935 [Blastocatellia bacterium]|nr:hypothetical protein [Blastocatellia bacterium]